MLRVSWVELVWVGSGCLVAGGYDVWLFEVDVGVGVELWRRLWCLLCFTVGRVLYAGWFFGVVVSRAPVPRVNAIR